MFRTSSAQRAVPVGRLAAAAAALAVALLLCAVFAAAARGAGEPQRFDLTLSEGMVGGAALAGGDTLRVRQGESVTLRWSVDEVVDLHLHGYDIELRAVPGQTAEMSFRADLTGRFPVSRHGGGHGHGESLLGRDHETLLYLEVHPR